MLFLLGLLAIILGLLIIVGLHEAGHALVARCFGVKIQRISIGFGKPLVSWKDKQGIEWMWARWPLGGYVQLLNSRITPVSKKDKHRCFDQQPAYARILILVAGACANILTAWVALFLVFMMGYKQMPPVIDTIKAPSMAATAELKAGDRILQISGTETPSWRDVGMELIMHLGRDTVELKVQDKTGTQRNLKLNLKTWSDGPKSHNLLKSLGIKQAVSKTLQEQVAGVSLIQAAQLASVKIKYLTCFFFTMMKQLITGMIPLGMLLGPLGLFVAMAGSFLEGLGVFLYFIGTLSLAVAVVNLLPVPGLDGGSILYTLIEKVRGKPISVALEVLLHRLVFIAFFVLLVQLIVNDLERLLGV